MKRPDRPKKKGIHVTPKYNTETGERMQSDSTPSESPYGREDAYPAQQEYQQSYPLAHRHNLAARGFTQMFGLHPGMAFLTIVVDSMVFSGDIVSAGLLLPVAFGAAAVLGIITGMAQKGWYGDENRDAVIKGLIVALLTAIPSPLPYVLFIPAGIVGLFRRKRG
jgi:hypothetical protein